MEEMIAHYEDTKRNTFFIQLINLKQKCSMGEHIEDFQKLNIRENDILEKQKIDGKRALKKGHWLHRNICTYTKFNTIRL